MFNEPFGRNFPRRAAINFNSDFCLFYFFSLLISGTATLIYWQALIKMAVISEE